MDVSLKNSVLEIAELLKSLPETIQSKAFEMLLSHEMSLSGGFERLAKSESLPASDGTADIPLLVPHGETKSEEDIAFSDLHVKVRKFLERYGLTITHLNGLFYKSNNLFEPLYEDLKTTKGSESQIRIALLLALQKALQDGDFEFDGESVRQECTARKCYDAPNFTRNFNNSANLFDGYTTYSKASPHTRINEEGKKILADLVKELQ